MSANKHYRLKPTYHSLHIVTLDRQSSLGLDICSNCGELFARRSYNATFCGEVCYCAYYKEPLPVDERRAA